MLSNGISFHINVALYSRKFTRNLFDFKNINKNGYHIETMKECNIECLCIISIVLVKIL